MHGVELLWWVVQAQVVVIAWEAELSGALENWTRQGYNRLRLGGQRGQKLGPFREGMGIDFFKMLSFRTSGLIRDPASGVLGLISLVNDSFLMVCWCL